MVKNNRLVDTCCLVGAVKPVRTALGVELITIDLEAQRSPEGEGMLAATASVGGVPPTDKWLVVSM